MRVTADILLITVTEVETRAVLEVAPQHTQQPWTRLPEAGRIFSDLGQVGGASVVLVQSAMGAMGLGAAAQTVQRGIEVLHPISVIMVGIAFGMDERRQRIGDVLVADKILRYDPQKVGVAAAGQPRIIPRGTRADVSPWLLQAFRSGPLDGPPAVKTARRLRWRRGAQHQRQEFPPRRPPRRPTAPVVRSTATLRRPPTTPLRSPRLCHRQDCGMIYRGQIGTGTTLLLTRRRRRSFGRSAGRRVTRTGLMRMTTGSRVSACRSYQEERHGIRRDGPLRGRPGGAAHPCGTGAAGRATCPPALRGAAGRLASGGGGG